MDTLLIQNLSLDILDMPHTELLMIANLHDIE